MMPRPGRELAIAHGPQFAAHRRLGQRDAKFLVKPLRQIDEPPAHHAVDRRDRTAVDHLRDAGAGASLSFVGSARRFAVQ